MAEGAGAGAGAESGVPSAFGLESGAGRPTLYIYTATQLKKTDRATGEGGGGLRRKTNAGKKKTRQDAVVNLVGE